MGVPGPSLRIESTDSMIQYDRIKGMDGGMINFDPAS